MRYAARVLAWVAYLAACRLPFNSGMVAAPS